MMQKIEAIAMVALAVLAAVALARGGHDRDLALAEAESARAEAQAWKARAESAEAQAAQAQAAARDAARALGLQAQAQAQAQDRDTARRSGYEAAHGEDLDFWRSCALPECLRVGRGGSPDGTAPGMAGRDGEGRGADPAGDGVAVPMAGVAVDVAK